MTEANEMEKLPEGWKKVKLEEVAHINMGQSPPSNVVNENEIGIPFLQGNAEFAGKYPIPQKWVTKPLKISRKNDILISVRAPVGAINKANMDYCIGRGLAAISFKSIDGEFGWFGLNHWKHQLETLSQGSTFEAISKDDLKNLLLLIPASLPEQHKIADILETVDNAIEKTDKIIEKYKRIKQGLMQDLLTRGVVENDELGVMSYELRDEQKHGFKDSPLGRIPEAWKVVVLGEVGKIISGSTPDTSNKEFWDGDIVWITPDDLSKSKKYIDNSSRKITLKGLRSCSAKLIKEDSIIISSRAPIGYLEINKVQIATNQGCKSIELNNNIFVEFFYYNLHRYIQKMINLGSGTTFTEISKSQLKKMMISLPKSIEEQHRIASNLSQMDQTIEKEQKYKQKLERIEQGLMEDLLTGKVRVNHLIKEGEKNVQPA